jgi:phage terminase large subunit-like protein
MELKTYGNLLKNKSKDEIMNFISDLGNKEIKFLLNEWGLWARQNQLPPNGNWVTWLILAGRGWG